MPTAKFVKLTSSSNPLQQSLVEEVLKDEDIPFEVREQAWLNTILGAGNPMGFREFLVPEDRLQEAKDALCGNGIVCDVSERMLRRSLDEIVRPLLEARPHGEGEGEGKRDLCRLAYFVGINNKETVRALFEAVRKEKGGEDLLEDLFFHLAREDSFALRILARVLHEGKASESGSRFLSEWASAEKEARARLLDVLPELPASHWRLEVVVEGLRDGDPDVRAAAGEALYTIRHGDDCGYDPDAPEAEREEAIEQVKKAMGGGPQLFTS